MAKNVTKPVHVHVSKNTKTPAQRERAEQNKLKAAERLQRLQAIQTDAKYGRLLGMTGRTDEELAAQFRAFLADQNEAMKESELRGKVNEILTAAGTYRKRIEGFLAARINKEASFVLEKINDFMSRPRNRDVKEYVDHVIAHRNQPVPTETAVEVAA